MVVVGLRSESCSVNISYSEMWSEVDVLSFFRKMPLIENVMIDLEMFGRW